MKHPLAEKQFAADLEALEWADACVLVPPCGRSAHTEAGWMAGRGKKVVDGFLDGFSIDLNQVNIF